MQLVCISYDVTSGRWPLYFWFFIFHRCAQELRRIELIRESLIAQAPAVVEPSGLDALERALLQSVKPEPTTGEAAPRFSAHYSVPNKVTYMLCSCIQSRILASMFCPPRCSTQCMHVLRLGLLNSGYERTGADHGKQSHSAAWQRTGRGRAACPRQSCSAGKQRASGRENGSSAPTWASS